MTGKKGASIRKPHAHAIPAERAGRAGAEGGVDGRGRHTHRRARGAARTPRHGSNPFLFISLSLRSLSPPFKPKGNGAGDAAAGVDLPLSPKTLHYAEIEAEYQKIRGADLGGPLALVDMNIHPELTAVLSENVTFSFQTASILHSAAWFFDSPAIGLPGIGAHFKLAAQVATNDGCRVADLICKTGGHPRVGDIPAPPHDWHTAGEPDVLRAFEVALCLTKVQYQGHSRLFALALKHNNPHAADFAGNGARAASEKVRAAALYVSHLKAVCPPPGATTGDDLAARIAKNAALKAFDRLLPVETADLAAAAAAEAVLPNHLLLGSKERELVSQSLAAGAGMGNPEARRALVLSKMNA